MPANYCSVKLELKFLTALQEWVKVKGGEFVAFDGSSAEGANYGWARTKGIPMEEVVAFVDLLRGPHENPKG